MKLDCFTLSDSDTRIDRLCRHSETMSSFLKAIDTKKTNNEELKFLGTDSISKLVCHCAKESANPSFQKRALKNLRTMNSISKSLHDESKPKDTPTVKGILTLFFCILYAGLLFVTAGVLSKAASSLGRSACSTQRVNVQMWEADTKQHMEVRQNRFAHTRWGR